VAEVSIGTAMRTAHFSSAYAARVAICGLIAMTLLYAASKPVPAQQAHILLDDQKARATAIEVSLAEPYTLKADKRGSVWVALDPFILSKNKGGQKSSKRVRAGDAEIVGSDEELQFRTESGLRARLVVIDPRMPHQELTVSPFTLSSSIEDASERNATLLVAISDCRFRDVRNLGDESEWTPSKPQIVAMSVGNVKWIRPGIHHFKNLGLATANLVSIEW